jgi:hypothetical protein
VPILDDREPEYRDRDAFVYALLGLISYGRRIERALSGLDARAPAKAQASSSVYVALGAVSLSRRLTRELLTWIESARPDEGVQRHRARKAPSHAELWR